MNCSDVHQQLPALLYGDLRPEVKAMLERHLADCADCRRELTALQGVRRLLSTLPVPTVSVDLPRLYEQALERQLRRARRWRRAALWISGAAALLLLALFGLRLEARFEEHQLVLRWGNPPAQESIKPVPAPSPPEPQPLIVKQTTSPTDEQLKLLQDLIHAVADDVQAVDRQQRRDAAQFRTSLKDLQQQNQERWIALERSVKALYLLSQKGE